MRVFFLTVFFTGIFTVTFAATDSLIIKGRILNLSGRLYRQAPSITFSRNNILQAQSELTKQAPLEADGSFRVSLPLLFPKEEFYLDYGGKAYTTFLGSPGTVEITFDGDSLLKAKKLFYFAGVNADANNQYPHYMAAENKLLNENKESGTGFFSNFWEKSPSQAKAAAAQRAKLRLSATQAVSQNNVLAPELYQWVKSVTDEEQLQNLYEYTLSNQLDLEKDLLDSLNKLATPPLTAQRVAWANRFGEYADRKVEDKRYTTPSRANSLPVKLTAALIRTNSPKLTDEEGQRVDRIIAQGLAEKSELDFLNSLYARNEMSLNLIFNYERESRTYSELFDSVATEFLNARYLAKNFYRFKYNQQMLLSKHIQSRIQIPQFRQSLDEIVQIEVKDSINISKLIAFKDVQTNPTEVLPGYFLTASNDRGTNWLNTVIDQYKGQPLYLLKWNLEDPKSREELDYVAALQAMLPENIVFIYLHLPDDENPYATDLIKQFIVRHRLKGVHMFLDNSQAIDLLFKLNPMDAATFSVIKPNGKFGAKKGPAPSGLAKTAEAILEASQK